MQIICDWGTSKLKAFLSDGHKVLDQYESDLGIKNIVGDRNQFSAELEKVTTAFGCAPNLEIQLSGMVGSKNGWIDAGYVSTPVGLADVASNVVILHDRGSATIIPGLKHVCHDGSTELMRGEETQVFGLLAIRPDATKICLPGTHSKWVKVEGGKITEFRSYMTGDLFASLCEHSIFREQIATKEFDSESFVAGCDLAYGGCSLDDLFRLRSDYVCDKITGCGFYSYLSGFLIANEIRAENVSGTVFLCASETLLRPYTIALEQSSVTAVAVGTEKATIAGHLALRQSR